MQQPIAPIEEIIAELKAGRMVIILDDEDRENEGDLVLAAECVRAEDINFMARYARGLICLTLSEARCRRLRLPLMVSQNDSPHRTNFTVSIEAASGVTTGISAADRATTIKAAVAKEARAEDLIQPGHIFPLMAQPGGVLTRAGHTEAGCDLARLAGFEPAAVIVEILNDDGSMARLPDLIIFAQKHGLKIGTIADLIRYRLANEPQVERVLDLPFNSRFGEFRLFLYQDVVGQNLHFVLVKGEIHPEQPVAVRVHLENPLCDLLAEQGCGWPLSAALARMTEEAVGVVIVLRQQDNQRLFQQLERSLTQEGKAVVDSSVPELRTYGIGAQILKDLGVRKMRVFGAQRKYSALAGFDLEIVEYIGR
jgi:3,4-dihydroxy 2-butanone 4-phosphate synthase/GTP cyclohydrolase II